MTDNIIDTTNINEKVYKFIKQNIINLEYPSGHKLSLNEISKMLGVSNTPIKEALFKLSGEGLVEITSRMGIYVKNINQVDIHEILQIRLFLESAVVAEIAPGISNENLQYIRDIYAKSIALSVNPSDIESYKVFMEYDGEFHLSFFRILANERLLNIYKNLNAHMQIVRFRLMNRSKGKFPKTDEGHMLILDALCQHDAMKAREAVSRHLIQIHDACILE